MCSSQTSYTPPSAPLDLRCDTVDVHEANGKLVAQQDVSPDELGHGTGVEPQGPHIKVSHKPPFLSMRSVRLVCCSPKALRQYASVATTRCRSTTFFATDDSGREAHAHEQGTHNSQPNFRWLRHRSFFCHGELVLVQGKINHYY